MAHLSLLGAQLVLLGVALAGIHLTTELRKQATEERNTRRWEGRKRKGPGGAVSRGPAGLLSVPNRYSHRYTSRYTIRYKPVVPKSFRLLAFEWAALDSNQ